MNQCMTLDIFCTEYASFFYKNVGFVSNFLMTVIRLYCDVRGEEGTTGAIGY